MSAVNGFSWAFKDCYVSIERILPCSNCCGVNSVIEHTCNVIVDEPNAIGAEALHSVVFDALDIAGGVVEFCGKCVVAAYYCP